MKILKFLVIEDDPLVREVLCGALREALRELEREAVIFEASDPSEATRIVKQTHIELILLDLELPDTDGFEFLRKLQALLPSSPFPTRLDLTLSWYPTVSFVVVSERQDYDIFENGGSLGVLGSALAAGAVGFIPKSASRETILDAFRSIFAGGTIFRSHPRRSIRVMGQSIQVHCHSARPVPRNR